MTVRAAVLTQTIDESKRVLNRMEKKEARVLVRTGGYGRSTMRRTIKRRKATSAVGSPPNAHAKGNQGLKDVRYSVTKHDASVTIGHIKYPRNPAYPDKHGVKRSTRSHKAVPQLLNEGGSATMTIDHPSRGTSDHPANYRPRPFRQKAYTPTFKFFTDRLRDERL